MLEVDARDVDAVELGLRLFLHRLDVLADHRLGEYLPLVCLAHDVAKHTTKALREAVHCADTAVFDLAAARERAIAAIERAGGYDAIVGFSQGGELAMLLAEDERIRKAPARPLKLVACFGADKSGDEKKERKKAAKSSRKGTIEYSAHDHL